MLLAGVGQGSVDGKVNKVETSVMNGKQQVTRTDLGGFGERGGLGARCVLWAAVKGEPGGHARLGLVK